MKPTQPELPLDGEKPKPRTIETNSSAEFLALCDRATRGELVIESVERGKGNGQWIATVRYEHQS